MNIILLLHKKLILDNDISGLGSFLFLIFITPDMK